MIEFTNDHVSAFLSKLLAPNERGCLIWSGAKRPLGYGNVRIGKRHLSSHRAAYMMFVGPIPRGLCVIHLCDEPGCCNHKHLALGTKKANSTDMYLKGRGKPKHTAARGETNGNSKFDEEDVRNIRRIYAAGLFNQYEIAEAYGVCQTAISSIIRNKTWGHIQ